MQTIATNENNDIFLDSKGNLALKTEIEAIGNVSVNAVKTLRGEMSLDTTIGVPYFDTIFSTPPEIELFQAYVTDTLNRLDGVNRLTAYTYEQNNGFYSYKAKLDTIYGEVIING